jgi:hypothetical protein
VIRGRWTQRLVRSIVHVTRKAAVSAELFRQQLNCRNEPGLRGEIETTIEIRATGGGARQAARLATATETAILATLGQPPISVFDRSEIHL